MLPTASAPGWGHGTEHASGVSGMLRKHRGAQDPGATAPARPGGVPCRATGKEEAQGSPALKSPFIPVAGVPLGQLLSQAPRDTLPEQQLPGGTPAPAGGHIYIASAHFHLFTYFRGKLPGFMAPDRLPRGRH